MLTGGLTAFVSGWFRSKVGQIGTPVVGFALMAAGFAGIALTQSIVGQYLSAGLTGCGVGFAMPTFMTVALQNAPARRRGVITALITASIFLGQFLSPLASQPLVEHFGYDRTFLFCSVAMVVLAVVTAVSMALNKKLEQNRQA